MLQTSQITEMNLSPRVSVPAQCLAQMVICLGSFSCSSDLAGHETSSLRHTVPSRNEYIGELCNMNRVNEYTEVLFGL